MAKTEISVAAIAQHSVSRVILAKLCDTGAARRATPLGQPQPPKALTPVVSPNILAYFMITIWPVVAYVLYLRLDPARALIWTILAGYLILPPLTVYNLPVVPDFDKTSIPNLSALALAVFMLGDRVSLVPQGLVGRGLMVLFVLSPFATVLTNGDPIEIFDGDVQGMRIYDSVAAVSNQLIRILPFFLARRYLADAGAMRALCVALVAAGFAYSVPMLIETQLSPQMNVWIYGFFQHDFLQTIRAGGFRPVVFLQHGLWVAFFTLMCLMASVLLLREGPAARRPYWLLAVGYMALLLLACKSFGPIIYALALLPVLLFAPRRAQVLLALLLALIVVIYPLLRGAHLVPLDAILAYAESISPARAESLAYRIGNEEQLLDHAAKRPWFGWGGYGRNLILDPVTGRILTIPDGEWIITLGIYGWFGYIAEFGLVALPLVWLGREALPNRGAQISLHAAGIALILAANLLDLLPNGTLVSLTWLMAGALLGHAEMLRNARIAKAGPGAQPSPAPRRTVI